MVYTMKYFTVRYLVLSQLINTWRQPEILEIAAQERERGRRLILQPTQPR